MVVTVQGSRFSVQRFKIKIMSKIMIMKKWYILERE